MIHMYWVFSEAQTGFFTYYSDHPHLLMTIHWFRGS